MSELIVAFVSFVLRFATGKNISSSSDVSEQTSRKQADSCTRDAVTRGNNSIEFQRDGFSSWWSLDCAIDHIRVVFDVFIA
jgi:hypothetical protein